MACYSAALFGALLVTLPWWLPRLRRGGRYREGLAERLGRVPARLAEPSSPAVWMHAVSVGEVLAASSLVQQLMREFPSVYVSTTTRTGQALAGGRFGTQRVFYFPLDFRFAVRRWLRFVRPSLLVLVESELWPRLLLECRELGIPVAVVNARISDRSWPRYWRLRRLWKPLLGSLTLVLAQSPRDAERLRALGAPHAYAAGNLKFDTRAPRSSEAVAAVRARLAPGTPLVVCGSTLEGEEALLLDRLPLASTVTVLAPRHPERFPAVAALLAARGLPHVRRSGLASVAQLTPGTVLLLDTIGELPSLFSLATVAVVGGGFLHPGGHNPLEPAQWGVPTVIGPGYANFQEIVRAFQQAEALCIEGAQTLANTVTQLLDQPLLRQALGQRAQVVFEQHAGATARTLEALLPLLAGERTPA